MSVIEQRCVIKFLTREGVSCNEICERLSKVYGASSLKISAIKKWSQLFRLGRESVEDDERCGRPLEGTSQERIDFVEKIVLDDRRLKVKEIAKLANLSETTTWRIIHDHLNMKKVSARWVPRNLSAIQKQRRVQTSQDFLDLCGDDPDKILSRIVTGDETWVHLYDPESKRDSMEWRKPGEAPPRKFKVRPSAGKVMATIFWDQKGIIMIDYLQNGRTITGEYYAELLKKLRVEILKKRRGLLTSKVLLLQDNAPAHSSKKGMAAVIECGYEILEHPPYSPDLAPSDFFLFPNLKKHLRGKHFLDFEELKVAISDYFGSQPENYFSEGIAKLVERCNKCVHVKGDYVEK